ncbi:MAG: hypothetical protein IJZ15_06555 [Oscillospiraceae bacterium]|nr:hypothetical protein [Oscillospiraceae bacterium]
MTKRNLYIAWAVLYAACAGLGFVPNPRGGVYAALFILALLFFVPPTILIYRAIKGGDIPELKRIRAISLIWLGLTLVMLALNFLSVSFTEAAGKFVYWLLILVSSPMVCGQIWVISLFLWGCLLSATWQEIFKRRKNNG